MSDVLERLNEYAGGLEGGLRIDGLASDLHDEITELRRLVSQLGDAIRPLARLDLNPGGFDMMPPDQVVYRRDNSVITVGDVKEAAHLLNSIGDRR
jgi:hypothetical protein